MEVNASFLSRVTFACAPDNLAEVFSRYFSAIRKQQAKVEKGKKGARGELVEN